MRKSEREITDRETIDAILDEARICRIGMCLDNIPYVIPMNFGFKDGCIYLHSAKEGKKIDILKRNPYLCFETEGKVELKTAEKACNWGMRFFSVIGWGEAKFIDEAEEKIKALDIIMHKYAGERKFDYIPESLENVQVFKIQIQEITGKKAGY